MNYVQEEKLIDLLEEHNDLQRHRNTQLSAIYNKLSDVEHQLKQIKEGM